MSPQNCDEFADSSRTRVTTKSSKLSNQSASQLMLWARVTSSRAAVGVGTGDGCGAVVGAVALDAFLPTRASRRGRRWSRARPESSYWRPPRERSHRPVRRARPEPRPGRAEAALQRALCCGGDRSWSHPFLEGRMGFRPEEGLLASSSAPRLPGEPSAPQWLHATHQRPFTVAGPRGIHTRLPSPPTVERDAAYPTAPDSPGGPQHSRGRPLESLAATRRHRLGD